MNLLQQFTNSIWNFDSYKSLSKTKGSKSFLYILLLFMIVYLVFFINTSFKTNDLVTSLETAMQEDVPDFRLANGKFSFDGAMPYKIDDNGFLFIIDTTGETQQEDLNTVFNGVLITEKEMISVSSGKTEITPFELLPFEISKDQVLKFIPSIKVIVLVFLAIWSIFAFGAKLFGILMLALITMIANAMFNKKLTFGNQWNIAIYASTLPILITCIHSLFGSPLGGFMFFVYWILAITYVFLGVYHISKNDDSLGTAEVLEIQP